MVTILNRRQHGYDVRIYTREHGPAHVHVFRGENRVKVNLAPLQFSENRGFTSRELRVIQDLVEDHLQVILREWERLHPDK